jgi:dTDP-glucose 4,6-dehydratase/UDP-glucose 4-epimerase
MKLLIIGSKGFIGSHCLSQLRSRHEVFGCDIFTDYTETDFYLVDPAGHDYEHIFQQNKFDACINCAGAASVPGSLSDPLRDFDLNVQCVARLLEAIRRNCPKCKFVNLSSAAVYGNAGVDLISEHEEVNPVSPYGFHKFMSEKICEEYYRFFGVGSSILRIFSAYGPGLRKQILWDLYKKSRSSDHVTLFGTGAECRDYIYVDDIVKAIEVVLHHSPFQASVYNLGNGVPVSTQALSEMFLNDLAWKGRVSFNAQVRAGDPKTLTADISNIKALGFIPSTILETGLRNYALWLKSLD